jgi:hypothetical protein
MEILDGKLPVMVFPVHLQRSAVVAIRDCPDRGQFIGPRSLKQAALQWIWHFQEPLGRGNCLVAEGRLGETAGRTGYHESIPQGIGLHEDQSAA